MSNIDDLTKMMEDMWKDAFPPRPFYGMTGRMGAINLHAQFVIEGREKYGGETLTEAEKKAIHDEVENSRIWEDGMYELGGEEFVKYIGLEDTSKSDGTIVRKDSRGIWRIEQWKDHWRTNYKVITEEEARKLIEDNGGKLI